MRVHVVLPGVLCLWLVHTAAAAGRVVQLITGGQWLTTHQPPTNPPAGHFASVGGYQQRQQARVVGASLRPSRFQPFTTHPHPSHWPPAPSTCNCCRPVVRAENPSPFAAADPNDPQYVITLLDEGVCPSTQTVQQPPLAQDLRLPHGFKAALAHRAWTQPTCPAPAPQCRKCLLLLCGQTVAVLHHLLHVCCVACLAAVPTADNQPSELPQAGMLRHMLMTDAAGQRYNCSIPGTPSQFASAVAAQQQVGAASQACRCRATDCGIWTPGRKQ